MGAPRIKEHHSIEELSQVLRYERKTGLFFWTLIQKGISRNRPAGTLRPDGYVQITFEGITYFAHRMAWGFVRGDWPPPGVLIDHKKPPKNNNRFGNLQIADGSENTHHAHKLNKRNHSGYRGVSRRGKRYMAMIARDNRDYVLGCFDTAIEAAHAYDAKAKKLYGKFAALNFH
jgi:HNH endonuclease/AP2 domain